MAKPADNIVYASQFQLMWLKFKSHKLALYSVGVLIVLYGITFFSQFLMPHDYAARNSNRLNAPPQAVHFWDENGLRRPFVYALDQTMDLKALKWVYTEDQTQKLPIYFFVRTHKYKLWACSRATGTCLACWKKTMTRPRCTCWAPTRSAATTWPACWSAGKSRSPSDWWAWRSASSSAWCWAASPVTGRLCG